MDWTSLRLSGRLEWARAENALAAAEARWRAADSPLLDLTETNPTTVGLPYPAAAIAAALGREDVAVYRPAPRGSTAARRLIAETETDAGRGPLDPERLVLTASSSESYAFLLKLLCDPGDAILVPEPSYPLFDYLGRLEGVTPLPYRLADDSGGGDWHLDMASVDAALATAAGARARALVVVSPNNPTGSVLRDDELGALDGRCAARGMALIADEVFGAYVTAGLRGRVAAVAARPTSSTTFSLGGLSKGAGLPQIKLGWIAVGGPDAAARRALAALELVADTYLSVSAAVERALPDLLRIGAGLRAAISGRISRNRRLLEQALGPTSSSAATLLGADGGWSAIVRLPAVRSDEEWALALLERRGVLVHPGYFFDLPGRARVVLSLLPEPATFAEAIARLGAEVEEHAAGGGGAPGDVPPDRRASR
jgi:alanine-synthesizing transaminase